MNKLRPILAILGVLFLSLILNVIFGDELSARLSQLPLIKRFSLLNPKAPIVINSRESVRVSDANDPIETASAVRSKLSSLVYIDGDGRSVLAGNLLNWTADGYFIGVNSEFQVPNKRYLVVTGDGRVLDIESRVVDSATGLVLIDTNTQALPTISYADDQSLRPGQRILFVSNSLGANNLTFQQSYINKLSNDVAGQLFESDKITRGITTGPTGPLLPGQAAITLEGDLVGIWDGDTILSGDAVRSFANNFFSDGRAIRRASFGFKYKQITAVEAALSKKYAGAFVTAVATGQAAQQAGLLPGDVIVSVNGKKLADNLLLESILENIKPSESTELEIRRSDKQLTLTLVPKILK